MLKNCLSKMPTSLRQGNVEVYSLSKLQLAIPKCVFETVVGGPKESFGVLNPPPKPPRIPPIPPKFKPNGS